MGLDCREAGLRNLMNRWKKLAATTVAAATMCVGAFLSWNGTAHSGGETRTLALHQVHTKQSLTITYKKDGKYIEALPDGLLRVEEGGNAKLVYVGDKNQFTGQAVSKWALLRTDKVVTTTASGSE